MTLRAFPGASGLAALLVPVPVLVPVLLVLVLGTASFAAAEERLDHRNQTALVFQPVFERVWVVRTGERTSVSTVLALDSSLGIPLSNEGGEGNLGVRAGAELRGAASIAPYAAYRSFFGDDAWKTFFDATVFVRVLPAFGPGARFGAGVQHELSENLGVFVSMGISLARGDGLQVSTDGGAGVQVRFGRAGD